MTKNYLEDQLINKNLCRGRSNLLEVEALELLRMLSNREEVGGGCVVAQTFSIDG